VAAVLLAGESSRAMLASARLSCYLRDKKHIKSSTNTHARKLQS